MSKSKLFKTKKEIEKTIVDILIQSGIRTGAALGGSFAITAVKGKLTAKPQLQKAVGIAAFVLGSALEAASANAMLAKAGAGLSVAGAIHGAIDLFPNVGTKLGISLQGVDGYGFGETVETTFDWQKAVNEAEQMSGYEEYAENLQGTDAVENAAANLMGFAGEDEDEDEDETTNML